MSENQAKIIKILSAVGGLLGAAVCTAIAFLMIEKQSLVSVLLLLLAVAFLVLIYPLYQVSKLFETVAEQGDKLRVLANRQAKILNGENEVNKYSPFNKHVKKNGMPTGASVSIPNAAERTIQVPVSEGAQTGKRETGELTREFSAKRLNERTGELITVGKDEALSSKRNMTVGSETFEIHRNFRNAPRVMPKMMKTTIAAGGLHTVAVRYDGRVIATGYGQYGQCDVGKWTDVLAISAGGHHTLGLRSDGTCVAAGYNGYGQCDVGKWSGIYAVAAGACHSVALLENGTCIAVGDNTYGQCNVYDWTDIIAISANANDTVGLKSDGTLVATGANAKGDWAAIKWSGITAVATGGCHTVALRADGTCLATGNNANKQCEVARWSGIVAVASGNFHTVGLRSDGTVLAVGHNGHGQCAVSEWRDVIAIAAGRNHTVALTKNGNVLAVGDNTYSQCAVANMCDIKTIGV